MLEKTFALSPHFLKLPPVRTGTVNKEEVNCSGAGCLDGKEEAFVSHGSLRAALSAFTGRKRGRYARV